MDDWDADPVPAVAKNDDEAWGAAAATVPLSDDDDNFDSPSPLKKTNAVVIVTEVVPTPAASGDDEDWVVAMPVAPAAVADADDFRGEGGDGGAFGAPDPAAAQDDAFGGGTAIADTFNAAARTPPVIKKRVLDKTLHPPEKSKTFADFFVPQHSERYEDPVPDPREMPLRRNETHNLYSKEIAMSVATGADKAQEYTEKKTKKKSAIHYNGNRITSSHVWTDYQVRLLLGLINRNIHTAGKPEGIDKGSRRTVMERRKFLNDHLPKATDGHTHIGQWAYHDVTELLNNDIDRSNIPVVDVRDMIHRLVDERKGGQMVAHRFKAPHLTHRIVVAWKRKQRFVGDLKEWLGDKEREGRKFILARQKKENQQASQEVVYNSGRVVPASEANADVVPVRSGWGAGAGEENALGGDAEAVPEIVGPIEGSDSREFGGPAPAARPVVVAEWDDDDDGDVSPTTVLPSIETPQWGANDQPLGTGLVAFKNAAPTPTKAPTPEAVKVAEPLGDFGLADPFSAPLPGNTGFQNAAPAAPAAQAAVSVTEWDEDDSAPAVVQPANIDTVMADAPSTAFNVEPATGGNAGDNWGDDDDAAPLAPSISTTSGIDIPRSNPTGSLDTMMDNTNITSPTSAYQSSGFIVVNALARAAPTSAPPPSYTNDPTAGPNPNRVALLAAKGDGVDILPEREKRDPWAQNLEGAKPMNGGVSGFNAMPLAFNRLTGERADPVVVAAATAAAKVNATGGRMPLGVAQGNETPLPAGWGDSPKDVEMGGADEWSAESPKPAAAKPFDKGGENGGVADEGDGAQEKKSKEKKYVDLDARCDAADANDVELDY